MNKHLDNIKRIIMFWYYKKITLDISDETMDKLKELSKEQNKNLSQIVEDSLRNYIERNNTNINDSDDHISEKDIDNIICDHIIQNNSDLMSLNSKIKKIIDK